MAKGQTIAEMVKAWWKRNFGTPDPPPVPPEEKVFNPLKAKLGTTLSLDVLNLRQYTFLVEGIRENKLDYGKTKFHFTDYICRSTLQEGETQHVKVRVYKHDQPGRDFQILALKQWDTVAYDPGFKELLTDNQFDLTVDGEIESSFWRINDVKTPYKLQLTSIDKNGDVETQGAHLWDYWRTAKDEGGTEYKEFLFVEWDEDGKDDGEDDKNTGNFEIWRGEEIVRSRVHVI